MNPLGIDYAAKGGTTWFRLVLIGAAALSIGAAVYSESQRSSPNHEVSTIAEAVRPRPAGADNQGNVSLEEEVREAELLMAQLTMPWAGLFGALERAHIDDVALLALQPDAKRKSLQITGQARAFEVVLAYVGRLKTEANFDNVHLISTEIRTEHAQRPIGFSVSASWAGVQ